MTPAMRDVHTNEASLGVRVDVGGPLAGEIRQEDKTVAAWRNLLGFCGQRAIGGLLAALRRAGAAEGRLEPIEREAGGDCASHQQPRSWFDVAQNVKARLSLE